MGINVNVSIIVFGQLHFGMLDGRETVKIHIDTHNL